MRVKENPYSCIIYAVNVLTSQLMVNLQVDVCNVIVLEQMTSCWDDVACVCEKFEIKKQFFEGRMKKVYAYFSLH